MNTAFTTYDDNYNKMKQVSRRRQVKIDLVVKKISTVYNQNWRFIYYLDLDIFLVFYLHIILVREEEESSLR